MTTFIMYQLPALYMFFFSFHLSFIFFAPQQKSSRELFFIEFFLLYVIILVLVSVSHFYLLLLEPFGLFRQNLAQLNHSFVKRFHVCMCIYKGSSFFKGESILTFRFFKVMTFHFFSEQKIF